MESVHSAKRNRRASENALAIILAGGSGTRLKSLTRWHSKPAVPFGGKYRSIDFPLSNCINSGIRRICIMTQYKSHSLNTHIQKGWNFLRSELGEFIDLIPAQQRVKNAWYQGTADAIYQNLDIISDIDPSYILVLAGDHIYKMDYAELIHYHVESNADVTVGCIEVPKKEANGFGVVSIDENNRISRFAEKPEHPETMPGKPDTCLASMGIYVFSKDFLFEQLKQDSADRDSSHDFGKDILPKVLNKFNMLAYMFRDDQGNPAYWRDVGTVEAYYEANMDLVSVTPELNLYDESWPIWTYQAQLPPAKFVFDNDTRRGYAVDSLISAGCVVSGAKVRRSLLFNNVRVNSFAEIDECVILPDVEIGRSCRLKNTVIDQGCYLPPGTIIGYNREEDEKRFDVSPNGVVLVSKEMLLNQPGKKNTMLRANAMVKSFYDVA